MGPGLPRVKGEETTLRGIRVKRSFTAATKDLFLRSHAARWTKNLLPGESGKLGPMEAGMEGNAGICSKLAGGLCQINLF